MIITTQNEIKKEMLLKPLKTRIPTILYNNIMNSGGFYIVGGAVRSVFSNTDIKDYDLHFKSDEDMRRLIDLFENEMKSNENITKTSSTLNSETYVIYNNTIQFIKLYMGMDIEHLLEKFDFTVCQGAYDIENDNFVMSDTFIGHNEIKYLVSTGNIPYPISTMFRIFKYLDKGYKIANIELLKFILAINSIKLNTLSDLYRQLLGIDLPHFIEFVKNFNLADNINNYDINNVMDMIEDYKKNVLYEY